MWGDDTQGASALPELARASGRACFNKGGIMGLVYFLDRVRGGADEAGFFRFRPAEPATKPI